MKTLFRSLVLFALAPLFAAGAHAEQYPLWSAKKLLSDTRAPTVTLGKNGDKVDQVSRAAVSRAVTVTERLSTAYQMPVPDIYVTKQEGPNAFATISEGRPLIAIDTDMLRLAGDDDDMLASVVGHELGHLQAKHVTDGAQRSSAVSTLGTLLGAAVDIAAAAHGHDTGGLGTTLGGFGSDLANAKFSRDQEREADELGIQAMAKAGYDPSASPRMWRLMSQKGGGGNGSWFDSHPSSPEREQAMTALAEKLQPVYQASAHKDAAPASKTAVAKASVDPFPQSAYSSYDPLPTEVTAASAYARGHAAFSAKRFAEAEPLLKAAAQTGDERAMALLGDMAVKGDLRKSDVKAGRDYYQKSAAKGFGPAIGALGMMVLNGQGRRKDESEAVQMLRLADYRGDFRSSANLGLLYLQGQGLPKDMAAARELAEKSAASGDELGKALLGTLLRDGRGSTADPQRGLALLTEAAPTVPWAKYQLGVTYEQGLGTPADKDKALSAYTEAAAAGVPAAQARLKTLNRR